MIILAAKYRISPIDISKEIAVTQDHHKRAENYLQDYLNSKMRWYFCMFNCLKGCGVFSFVELYIHKTTYSDNLVVWDCEHFKILGNKICIYN